MHSKIGFISAFLILLAGCVDTWSDTSSSGSSLDNVLPECRAKAKASAEYQFRFEPTRLYLNGTNDTKNDIEKRETALCLQNKGFKLSRNF